MQEEEGGDGTPEERRDEERIDHYCIKHIIIRTFEIDFDIKFN